MILTVMLSTSLHLLKRINTHVLRMHKVWDDQETEDSIMTPGHGLSPSLLQTHRKSWGVSARASCLPLLYLGKAAVAWLS